MSISLLYSTFPDRNEAVFVARALLEKRLIACANIIDQAMSLYRWDGQVKEEPEVVMFAKTTSDKNEAAIALINDLHSYEVPCIVALPVEAGFGAFLSWVQEETH